MTKECPFKNVFVEKDTYTKQTTYGDTTQFERKVILYDNGWCMKYEKECVGEDVCPILRK